MLYPRDMTNTAAATFSTIATLLPTCTDIQCAGYDGTGARKPVAGVHVHNVRPEYPTVYGVVVDLADMAQYIAAGLTPVRPFAA